ncbi:hypothetical protein KUCAC02_010211 [Chaenocephalus aceratus]|uniref:Uncharacterized protein n=1 Tax=Chaenocephalus aceratus TaxID=36190 RepID=A0ACB9VZJ6_CHAAC|nr:hypothetical protein KUCAC02_010211 [Chaenocephalus aceratus]
MTYLTFFIPPLCRVLFPGVGLREQNELDLCVYIGAEPPPYWGIDVALWGPGTGEVKQRPRRPGVTSEASRYGNAQLTSYTIDMT